MKITLSIFISLVVMTKSCDNEFQLLDYKNEYIGTIYSNVETADLVDDGILSQYYKSGELFCIGKFVTDTYTQCCFAGPCQQYYLYKVGNWKFFHKNGKLLANGKFTKEKIFTNTSCEGGDSIYSGRVNDKWKFYDFDGNTIKASEIVIKNIQDGSAISDYNIRQ